VISDEIAVLFSPAANWPRIAKLPAQGHWLSKPLFALFVFGCAASLMASGRVTLRLALPAMLYGAFAPVLQIVALRALDRRAVPFRRLVDLFFTGHAATSLVLLAFATAWVWSSPLAMYSRFQIWRLAGMALLAWSAYVDFRFFRAVAGRTVVQAARDLMAHRILWGIPAMAIFAGPSAWQEATRILGIWQ
jgi:hypothetical protein